MFADSFSINLLIFLAGQAVAYGYLRTGRKTRGLSLMILSLVFVDVALVRAFAFEDRGTWFRVSLLLMQVYSLVELFLFTTGRLRRRLRKNREQREQRFRNAFLHYLRNDLEAAIGEYRWLLKADAWDLEATLALATALARQGESKQARRWFRSARALDLGGRYADVISDELKRYSVARRKAVAAAKQGGDPADPARPGVSSRSSTGTARGAR